MYEQFKEGINDRLSKSNAANAICAQVFSLQKTAQSQKNCWSMFRIVFFFHIVTCNISHPKRFAESEQQINSAWIWDSIGRNYSLNLLTRMLLLITKTESQAKQLTLQVQPQRRRSFAFISVPFLCQIEEHSLLLSNLPSLQYILLLVSRCSQFNLFFLLIWSRSRHFHSQN